MPRRKTMSNTAPYNTEYGVIRDRIRHYTTPWHENVKKKHLKTNYLSLASAELFWVFIFVFVFYK